MLKCLHKIIVMLSQLAVNVNKFNALTTLTFNTAIFANIITAKIVHKSFNVITVLICSVKFAIMTVQTYE